MTDKKKVLAKLLVERTVDGMKAVAERHGLISDGKIDISGSRVKFNHSDLDLRQFRLEECDLSGSVLTNCTGENVIFRKVVMRRVRISAEKGKKASFRGAVFDGAILDEVTMGPRTLDLSATTYRRAQLRNVTFMMGKLDGADFSEAAIADSFFRSADLNGAIFRCARLTRVSLERASLHGADFTMARFEELEKWGEANFDGATIPDDLRYQYGIVSEPLRKLDAWINRGEASASELERLRAFRERHREFLSNPEVMLIGSEYETEIELPLFIKMLKALKADMVQ